MKTIGLILAIMLMAVPVMASDVPLEWEAPTINSDGTELTDLAGYKIYYGSVSEEYTIVEDIPGTGTTKTVTGLSDGPWFFVVTAYDEMGNESAHSNEVNVEVVTVPDWPVLGCDTTASVCGKCVYNCDVK